ncbi:MAG: hypothetical protein J2P17_35485 [Mycobacterium sp.]|nr:hypothetical protein [Mycobacterium sp.]
MAVRTRSQLVERLTVGLIQTTPRFGAVDENLERIAALVSTLGATDLAVTPELSAHGYACDPANGWPTIDPSDRRLSNWPANAHAVGVGFAYRRGHSKPYNSYAISGLHPQPVQHKLHVVGYPPWNEHHSFAPGSKLNTFKLGDTLCANLICNDMWHPVAPWAAAAHGAEVLFAPAASAAGDDPAAVQRTWDVIIEHTARVLACYVVFVNRCGADQQATFWGGSRVVDPEGSELMRLGDNEDAVAVELDLSAVRSARRSRPYTAETNPAFLSDVLASLAQGHLRV